ncbi:MAG TPA: hypothetical protein VGB94_02630 [Acidobacteriaceae bacterium]
MKNAKDTFYVTLRDRLAALNPERRFVVRGLLRPGMMVLENEMVTEELPANVFILHWTDLQVDWEQQVPLATMRCEIQYFTDGDGNSAGMDRGRRLTRMDAELVKILSPQTAAKQRFDAEGASAVPGRIFWGDAAFESVAVSAERLLRVARVDVYSYEEPGE